MHQDTDLVATIAVSLAFAFLCGFAAVRLRLPPLLGYLVAGVLVGPFTPGFVADAELAPQLAEIGVILLMFGVGVHFSLGDLLAVKSIAIPGAIAQMTVATGLGAVAAVLWGWSFGAGVLFGLALSVASTVVLLRALETVGLLDSPSARISIGWLIVEDLVMVLTLVLLPAVATSLEARAGEASQETLFSSLRILGSTLGKLAAFLLFMLIVGRRLFPQLLKRVESTGSRELFTLAVAALAIGVAFVAAHLFGASYALGAFFAGVVIHESDLSHRAARDLQPLQDAFAVLFFVAVGMLFDPSILLRQPLALLVVVLIVVVGKSLAAYGIVRVLRQPREQALTVSAALAQVGEFSFILAAGGVGLGILPPDGQSLIVAGALFSITLNPLVFRILGVDGPKAPVGDMEIPRSLK